MNAECTDFSDAFDMIEMQWQKVLMERVYNHNQMLAWLNANCKKRVRFCENLFVFEDSRDASLFRSRWK